MQVQLVKVSVSLELDAEELVVLFERSIASAVCVLSTLVTPFVPSQFPRGKETAPCFNNTLAAWAYILWPNVSAWILEPEVVSQLIPQRNAQLFDHIPRIIIKKY